MVGHHLRLEVDGGKTHGVLPQLDPHEITRMGIQPVDVGLAAAYVRLLAEIVDEALLDQLAEELRDGGDAHHERLAQLRDARIASEDIQIEYLLLEKCSPILLLDLFE